jgi:photosystem II stability/assembly factor-like uncharacterized protein
MNLEQAIARSVSNNEIVHCEAAMVDIEALDSEGSTDVVSQYGYVDVWGTTDAGDEWRLHVTPR